MILQYLLGSALLAGIGGVAIDAEAAWRLTGYSTDVVQLDAVNSCTVVRPWTSVAGPGTAKYPVIIWVNGWDDRRDNDTGGYLPGLIEWAQDGPYVVVADNARAPFVADALACTQWIVQRSQTPGSAYYGVVDPTHMGLAGHSQGGGVVLTARNLEAAFPIKGVIAMNPWNWGPEAKRWVDARIQDSPVFLLGGSRDETAPVATYTAPAWQAILRGGAGGIYAVLNGGTHNSEAWAPGNKYPDSCDFGRWQWPTTLWWRRILRADAKAGSELMRILNNTVPVRLQTDCGGYQPLGTPNWTTQYSPASSFSPP